MGHREHLELGLQGERLAEKFLKQNGYKTVVRRFSTPAGELDLVMRTGETIVFVEVKTRRDRRAADPEDAVTPAKRRRMLKAARCFLANRRWSAHPCRCDVVAVVLPAVIVTEPLRRV